MISPHKHDVLKQLKKHPKGSQNAPNGTIFSKIFQNFSILYIYLHSSTSCSMYQIEDRVL